jgi:hypothetical protein
MTTPIFAVVALIVLVGAVQLFAFVRLSKEMKTSHPSKWRNLGDPFKYRAFSIPHEWRWTKFICLREYRKLNNRRLTLHGDLVLACSLVILGLIIFWGALLPPVVCCP